MLPPEGPPNLSSLPDRGDSTSPLFSTIIPRINEELLRLQNKVQEASRDRIDAQKIAHILEVEALQEEIETQKKELSRRATVKETPQANANAKLLQDTVEAFKRTDAAREQYIDYLNGQLQECRRGSKHGHHPAGPSAGVQVHGAPLEDKMAKDMEALDQRHRITQAAFFEHMDRTVDYQNTSNANVADLQRQLEISKTEIKVLKEQSSLADKLKEEVESLQKMNASVENNLDDAIAVNSHLTYELETFQTDNADLKSKLAAFETENARLKGQLQENTEKLQKSSEKMTRLEKERKTSSNVLHRRGLHVEVLKNTVENLEADRHRLERAAAARAKFDIQPGTNGNSVPELRPNATPFTPSNIKNTDPSER
ncbi:uncharacterized protein DFL_002947 [Arthrobotrys flagrans]|uniref:Uncharacterized protein n=1 Tax=Arthrobotrys flagrans TaxID=97331 RepID=A0A437ABY3_ARTFL|nr:hypothetical protein DFL_002947 [Arthrobotrys flagrans]